jgi:hypothetical protein
MHCQHVNGFSVVFSELELFATYATAMKTQVLVPIILQEYLAIAAAAIPSRQALSTTSQIHARLYDPSIEFSFANDGLHFFQYYQ